jgi:hypothetical protein
MVSFESDVLPMFRQKDIQAMRRAFDLSSYADVRANAEAILSKLSDGSMPCDGAWPKEKVEVFRKWRDEGFGP